MSEPVVQRQAVPHPQEALREQIAQALHAADCGCTEFYQRHDDPALYDEYYQRLTDAVLPVVQAHERAACEEIEELAVELADERTLHQALRDAVSRLADEFARLSALERTNLHPAALAAYGFAEDAVRSLLGDKEAQQ